MVASTKSWNSASPRLKECKNPFGLAIRTASARPDLTASKGSSTPLAGMNQPEAKHRCATRLARTSPGFEMMERRTFLTSVDRAKPKRVIWIAGTAKISARMRMSLSAWINSFLMKPRMVWFMARVPGRS